MAEGMTRRTKQINVAKTSRRTGRAKRLRHGPVARAVVWTESRGLKSAGELRLIAGVKGRRKRREAHLRQRAAYGVMAAELLGKYRISIRKWRRQMCGVAYEVKYQDGRIRRWITAPRPRGPVSAAIFLHEVGHHAVGFHRYRLRCLEEYFAWQWALREMTARNIPVHVGVLKHYRRSMYHYVKLARRQGVAAQDLPQELRAFAHWSE